MSYLAEPGAAGSRHAANMWGSRQASGRQATCGAEGRYHAGSRQAAARQVTCGAAGRQMAGIRQAGDMLGSRQKAGRQ